MATKGEYRYQTDRDGNVYIERYGVDRDSGEGSWHRQDGDIPKDRGMSGRKITPRGRQAQMRNKRQAKQRAVELHTRGEASKLRAQEASEMPWGQAALIHGGREVDKLMAGTAELGDFISNVATGSEEALHRSAARAQEQEEKDRLFKEFDEDSPVGSGLVGASLPYLTTNIAAGPSVVRKAGQMYSGLKKKVGEGAKVAGGAVGREIKRQAARPATGRMGRVRQQLAKELESGVVDPATKIGARLKAQPPIEDFFRKGMVPELGGSTALGALEGGLHYSDTMPTGAMSSVFGTAGGRAISPYLAKGPDYNNPAEREALEWWKDEGYRADPGMDTGRPELQTLHSNLRTDKKYSEAINQVDRANDKVVTDVAGRAAGITPEQMEGLTPDRLSAHMRSLKSEYESLEKASVGKVTREDFAQLSQGLADLSQDLTKQQQKKLGEVQEEVFNLKQLQGRNEKGQWTPATFDGAEYQKQRSRLQVLKDDAYNSKSPGSNTLAQAYEQMIRSLDDGMARGVADYGGEASARMWRDLNERYAMSKTLMDKGMDPLGGIDTKKLSSHLMSKDAERTLTGRGGNIREFQQIARLNELKKRQRGGGLGRENVEKDEAFDSAQETSMMSTPAAGRVPLWRRAKLAAYMKGYPGKTGYLNFPSQGPYSPASLSRAMQQGRDHQVDAIQAGKEFVEDPGGHLKSGAAKGLDWLLEQWEDIKAGG
jgi:hypothetical protein